ncbi:uncharacterized protein [Anabrus simplex]|uniref:uncharacterized protein n=1 Tax=Anabrus simplex TaxID=316456 RepID=UPI0035A26701
MVSKSVAVFLLVALSAFQGTEANAFTDLVDKISSVVNETVNTMKQDFAKMHDAAEDIRATIQEKIAEVAHDVGDAIKQGVKEAEVLGANITVCIDAAQQEIQTARNASDSKIKACWETAREAIQPDMDLLNNDIQQATTFGKEIEKNASKCGFLDMVCQFNVWFKAGKPASEIISRVVADGVQFGKDFAVVRRNFTACSQEQEAITKAAVEAAYQEEYKCIQEKISAASSQ